MKTEIATLAGGCFWGVQDLLRKVPGVVSTRVGYTGGTVVNPTYEQVKTGTTGHAESLEITFDPERVTYEQILELFFRLHDPTTLNQQGEDRGSQYRSAVFFHDDDQRMIAIEVMAHLEKKRRFKGDIVTELNDASVFYPAEEYHQDYLKKNPGGYTCHYFRKW